MPKSLLLGNGSFLVGYDGHGQVKDFYYEYVGLDNQLTEEAVNRVGVWVDSRFSWLSDSSWETSINYKGDTLSGRVIALNKELELSITFEDAIYNEANIFNRLFTSDVEHLHIRSVKLIEKIENGDEVGVISVLVINELVLILENFYHLKKGEYIPKVLGLLSIKGMKILEAKKKHVVEALELMLKVNLDFTDCYLLQVRGDRELFTFDKKLMSLV
jgi:predicted nucleic acid-binding protein